jgi:ribonucleotide monophosphatase NagD (HAD superfamily)
MQLRDYTQINSNFFYSKHITPYNKLGKYEFKVNPKKLTQIQFNRLMEHVVFKKGFATLIQTKQGDFVFYGVTQDFTPKQVQNSIANLAKTEPTYFFRNVDYFNYGEFGYAENGKIVRYLKYNSEATDDENVVEWVGKPHDWEYNSHTFYTKQKLEDCEMFFDSEAVCNMIDYYLPFIKDGVDIDVTTYNGSKIKGSYDGEVVVETGETQMVKSLNSAPRKAPSVKLVKATAKDVAYFGVLRNRMFK